MPQVVPGAAPGSVVVSAVLAARIDEAWSALTDGSIVSQWWGVLSGDLIPGSRVRLDFEDGDFFDLNVECVEKPVVRWWWRFMGCGPRHAIELRLEEHGGGSMLTVTDSDPARDPEAVLALGEGWRDFTQRLQLHLSTGERTRYDWRSDVEVWAELPLDPDDARRLLIRSAAEWLPLESGASDLLSAHNLQLADGEEPAVFTIEGVHGTGVASVAFELRPDGIRGALPTHIAVAARGEGAIIALTQTGFRELAADDVGQRRLRRRFAAALVTAAERARQLAERAPASV